MDAYTAKLHRSQRDMMREALEKELNELVGERTINGHQRYFKMMVAQMRAQRGPLRTRERTRGFDLSADAVAEVRAQIIQQRSTAKAKQAVANTATTTATAASSKVTASSSMTAARHSGSVTAATTSTTKAGATAAASKTAAS
jgi:hypothetical protein